MKYSNYRNASYYECAFRDMFEHKPRYLKNSSNMRVLVVDYDVSR